MRALQRLLPTLLTYPEHLRLLKSICPQRLRDGDVIDHAAAFGAEGADDSDALKARFVEPALLGAIQSLRTLLESKQLHDDDSQRALLAILARFDADGAMGAADESAGSQAPAGSPAGVALGCAAASCAAAFDFFDAMFADLQSISLQSEVVALCRMWSCSESGFKIRGLGSRQRLAALADACLQRERADDRSYDTWREKKPPPKLAKSLFEVQAAFCDEPRELLLRWASELLPQLQERELPEAPTEAEREEYLLLDDCPLFNRATAPSFIAILFGLLSDETKKLKLPPAEAWDKARGGAGSGKDLGGTGKSAEKRREKRKAAAAAAAAMNEWANYVDDDASMDEERAMELLSDLKNLADAFVQLVLTTRVVTNRTLNKVAITHSARFISTINKPALPMMSQFFSPLTGQITALLKSLQPATRLLQVHCTMVKVQQQLAALTPAAQLKRELEGLIFQVKVMLQANDVREGFWMGNLKHKDLQGKETSSQMAVPPPKPKPAKKRKLKGVADDEDKGGEEDSDEEGDGDQSQIEEIECEDDEDMDEEEGMDEDEEE